MSSEALSRELSSSLFGEIKPSCVELTQLALVPPEIFRPESPKLATALYKVNRVLDDHFANNRNRPYILSPKIADYIFFPLSNLLKQKSLGPSIVTGVLQVLSFLIEHVWSANGEVKLLDQLYPVVLHLIATNAGKEFEMENMDFKFKRIAASGLTAMMAALPADYFDRKLHFLGSSITILLNIIASAGDTQEDAEVVNKILETLMSLYQNSVSSARLREILPGNVSKLVNYIVGRKNLHYTVVVNVLGTLSRLITKVFDDKDLKISPARPTRTFDDLWEQWNSAESEVKEETINIDTKDRSWLTATSKQLKISLMILFKSLLMTSANKLKVRTKAPLYNSIKSFVGDIQSSCFFALMNDFLPLGLDILTLLLANSDCSSLQEQQRQINELAWVLTESVQGHYSQEKLEYLYDNLCLKLEDLVKSKLSANMMSTDEDKLILYFSSIKLHFKILFQLSNTLSKPLEVVNGLELAFLRGVRSELVNASTDVKDVVVKESDIKVELPSYINANKIAKFTREKTYTTTDLSVLSKSTSTILSNREPLNYFGEIYTVKVENELSLVMRMLSSFHSAHSETNVVQEFLDDVSKLPLQNGITLWISNAYNEDSEHFDISEIFDETQLEGSDSQEEVLYSMISMAQDLIDAGFDGQEKPLSMALETIGKVSGRIPLADFHSDVLIDYLFPVIESISFQHYPALQARAADALNKVAASYYHGSIEKLVTDNSDILLNTLSLRLTSSGLTPALPSILLILLKISGVKLILTNQLSDVLARIFVLIDSYHAYGSLVEGFFVVFEEMVRQIRQEYLGTKAIEGRLDSRSDYKPWGITNMASALDMIHSATRITDPFSAEEDEEEEGEAKSESESHELADSDDEEETVVEKEWASSIPKQVYMHVQRIFNYGFRLLSHPSTKLKIQILRTLESLYPLLNTDSSLLLPLIVGNWPSVIALMSNSHSLSLVTDSAAKLVDNYDGLVIAALNFGTTAVKNDDQKFLSKQFINTWEYIAEHSGVLKTKQSSRAKQSSLVLSNPRLLRAYSSFFLTGLNIYGRKVPDLTAYKMVQFCMSAGIPDMELSQDTRNLLWVLKHT